MSERENERKTGTPAARDETGKSRSIEDSEAEGVVGGTTADKPNYWHKLPDGSGSGAGE